MADEYVDITTVTRVDIKALREQKQDLRDTRQLVRLIQSDDTAEIDGLVENENERRRFFKDELNAQIDELTEEIDRLVAIKNG